VKYTSTALLAEREDQTSTFSSQVKTALTPCMDDPSGNELQTMGHKEEIHE